MVNALRVMDKMLRYSLEFLPTRFIEHTVPTSICRKRNGIILMTISRGSYVSEPLENIAQGYLVILGGLLKGTLV
jgi:hypothetical protein